MVSQESALQKRNKTGASQPPSLFPVTTGFRE
jgi:hypothetical protein